MFISKTAVAALLAAGLFSCSPKQAVRPQTVSLPQVQKRLAVNTVKQAAEQPEISVPPIETERLGNRQYVVLDFDNADLNTVLSKTGRTLNLNYQADPGITGSLTIRSDRKFPEKYFADVFKNVLRMNGLKAVKQGASCKVVPANGAKKALAAGVATEIIPLEYVNASDIEDTIRDLMPSQTYVTIYEPANLVIAVSTPHGMARLMNIINALDIPFAEKENKKPFVYYVENGSAKNLADAITRAYSVKGPAWAASTLARPGGKIYGKNYEENRRRTSRIPGNYYYADSHGGINATSSAALSSVRPDLSVTPYSGINALIIKSTPGQYLSLLGLLKHLDVPPKQVLIDVLEAEVKLGPDTTEFGLEWLLKMNAGKFGLQGGFTNGNVFVDPSTSSGLNVNPPTNGGFTGSALTLSPIGSLNLATFLTALQDEGRLDVLASPHVLAVDGQTADIAIGDEVPVATGLFQQPSEAMSNTLVASGQIRYKIVGKLLSVTPHITDDGKVSLQLSLEVSDLGATVPIAGQTFQAFTAKKADTTAIVKNGHTLLIGGMMSESKETTRSGVPFLSNIPILGYLFSYNTQTYEKDELIVLVTPYVVSNQDQADALTGEFSDRLRIIKGIENP